MSFPVPVILDQKDWIYLARGQDGAGSSVEDTAKYLRSATKVGKVITPLSITHFGETVKRLDSASRTRLAQFMYELSQGNVVAPAPVAIELEIENACRRYRGVKEIEAREIIFGTGISLMVGARLDFQMSGTMEMDPKTKSDILEKIESAETILKLMEDGFSKDQVQELCRAADASAASMEKARAESLSIKEPNIRYRVEIDKYFHYAIDPPLVNCLLNSGTSPVVLESTYRDKGRLMDFFRTIPTAYCLFELDFYRNSQQRRKIQANDLNDIMGLAVAVPYARVVLTEPIWQNGIRRRNLDRINGCTVLTSSDLPKLPDAIEKLLRLDTV